MKTNGGFEEQFFSVPRGQIMRWDYAKQVIIIFFKLNYLLSNYTTYSQIKLLILKRNYLFSNEIYLFSNEMINFQMN